jgi:signal transduction histidine kinase
VNFVAVKRDVTRLVQLEEQLRQAQKLEAIGQLAAGIAHEINTPAQFIGDNVRFLQEAFTELLACTAAIRERLAACGDGSAAELAESVERTLDEAQLDELGAEVPEAIEHALDGVRRVTQIVLAMREFSSTSGDVAPIDLNRAIGNVVTVTRNEWKYVAHVVCDLDPALPAVPCTAGDINQVLVNLIVNGAQAIADLPHGDGERAKGRITITTRHADGMAEIRVADTGCGIPEHVRGRIFDPFFTTRPVGTGVGHGLSFVHHVVVHKLRGSIDVETAVGQGTCFVLRLPLSRGAAE